MNRPSDAFNELPDDQFRTDTGRGSDGAFVRVTHIPSGVSADEHPVDDGRPAAAIARLREFVTAIVLRGDGSTPTDR